MSGYLNLGRTLLSLGKPHEAIASYREALRLKPGEARAQISLGVALKELGQLEAAAACFQRAVELNPNDAAAHSNLGSTLALQQRPDDAIACYRRALELQPDAAEVYNNLGTALRDHGKLQEAITCYQRAIELNSDFAEAHCNLGLAWQDAGNLDQAVASCRRAVELKPGLAAAHHSLGRALHTQELLDAAAASFRRAIELKPDCASTHVSLGVLRKDQGQVDDALRHFRRALQLKPDDPTAHSNLIYTLQFCPDQDPRTIYEAHRVWEQCHAAPLASSVGQHANDRSADRRLRIGYVSPNFCEHVVGINLLPLLGQHDHRRFEIFCYDDTLLPDPITGRLRATADEWRHTVGVTDEQLADMIRADRIDILVDLSLHMARNRLLTFARKPAPVQLTFAGYPGTTGLSTMGYRLTDPYLDPPGLDDRYYAEKSLRLPDTFWCYAPLGDEPAVSTLPAVANGYVTFGCLSNFCKVNEAVLKLWARVLVGVDQARLVILAPEGTHRQRTLDLLSEHGVVPQRVSLAAHRPRQEYLRLYHDIDLGLDTFPYNGHTTSLDALWMGVPVITLVGKTVVGRAGLSQLTNLGLPEFVASTPEQFLAMAVEHAAHITRLAKLRATLRQRMQNSPLTDAPRFARSVEAAYRAMWQRWCSE